MSLIRINSGDPLPALCPAPGVGVTILIHGYRYDPADPENDPHREILSLIPVDRPRIPSWPRKLGFGQPQPHGGSRLCIAFGWPARGSLWQAYAAAGRAGADLARMITHLRAAGAGEVSVLAHSLGARVALCALPDLMAGDVRRMVLLTGAEFTPAAQRALQSPAGRLLEVLNITSRENDLFDLMFEMTLSPLGRRGRALGTGFDAAQVLTVQIDCPAHRAALHRLGHRIAPPSARICHWSAYLRPGLFPLYRRFLHRPETLPFAALRTNLPRNQAPRWSRLVSPHGAGFGQSTPA